MKNTKLAELIANCSKEELKKIPAWLSSPAHCTDSRLLILFNTLISSMEKGTEPEKKQLFKLLFQGHPYNEALLRNLVSDLLACIEQFLVWNKLQSLSSLESYLLLRVYNEKKLAGHFEMRLRQFEKSFDPYEEFLFDASLGLTLIEEEKTLYSFMNKLAARKKNFSDLSQLEVLHQLMRSFFIKYLHYYLVALNNEFVSGNNPAARFEHMNALLNMAENLFSADSFITINALLIKQVLKPLPDSVFRDQILLKIASPDFKVLNNEDKRNILTTVVNLFTSYYTKGDLGIIPQLTSLMDLALEARSPVWHGVLSGPFFTNYVLFNLYLGKDKTASDFVKKFAHLLEPTSREFTTNLALANIAFSKKDFHTAQQLLSRVVPDSPQRFLGVKNLLLKIFFEKREFDLVEPVIDSLRHKLMNEKNLSEKNRIAEKNFLKFYQKLMLLAETDRKPAVEKLVRLRNEIDISEYVMQKHWLIQKTTLLLN